MQTSIGILFGKRVWIQSGWKQERLKLGYRQKSIYACLLQTINNQMREVSKEEKELYDLQQIKQRPSRYQAKPIAKAIRQVMARSGLGQTQAAEELLKAWKTAAGPALASVSRPGIISRGVLQVFVQDSSSLLELHMCRKQLLTVLRESMPQLNIKDIRGRIG